MKDPVILSAEACRNFFLAATEGLALVDNKGTIEAVNEAFARVFGYTQEEMTGMTVEDLLPEDLRVVHKGYRNDYNQAPAKRSMGHNRDLVGRRKDGTLVPVEISLSPIVEDDKPKVAVLLTDITERKKMQAELKELNARLHDRVDQQTKELRASQELYSLISQNFPNGTISVFDRDLNYVFVEGQELRKLGIKSSTLQGTSYLDRLPEEIRDQIKAQLEHAFINSGSTFEVSIKGNIYEITAVPLTKSTAEVDQILVVERNVTAERNAKEEMKRNLAREKELNELKSRFVSMASHEFRTPLTTINSSALLIEKYTESDQQDKRVKHIGRIQNSVTHLTGVLNDILSLSKLEEGEIQPKPEQFDLNAFVADLEEQMLLFADGKAELHFTVSQQCPSSITTDPNLLRNIMVNLVSNAIKYSPRGGDVEVSMACMDGVLSGSVRDHGIGIPQEDQEKLFQRFFRASNVTNIEGTGLGLNIVQRMLEVMGGSIDFTSQSGEGTEFRFNIPIT